MQIKCSDMVERLRHKGLLLFFVFQDGMDVMYTLPDFFAIEIDSTITGLVFSPLLHCMSIPLPSI